MRKYSDVGYQNYDLETKKKSQAIFTVLVVLLTAALVCWYWWFQPNLFSLFQKPEGGDETFPIFGNELQDEGGLQYQGDTLLSQKDDETNENEATNSEASLFTTSSSYFNQTLPTFLEGVGIILLPTPTTLEIATTLGNNVNLENEISGKLRAKRISHKGDVTAASNRITLAGLTEGAVLTNFSIDVNENALQLPNFSGTLPVTSGGTGTSTTFTQGSVVFAGTGGTYTQDNANFFWDDTNNRLGIGIAVPTEKLEVNGTLRVGTADDSGIINLGDTITGSGNYTNGIFRGGLGTTAGGGYLNLGAWSGIAFNTSGAFFGSQSTRMVIDGATGNVGIGDTTPASLLSVGAGDVFQVNSSGDIIRIRNLTYTWPTAHATNGVLIDDGTGILNWGTLGGGSITANSLDFTEFQAQLDVDTNTDILLDGTEVLSFTNTGTGYSFIVNDEAADATPFIISNAGNVGIGDTSPAALLTVGSSDLFQVNSSGAIAAATGITSSGTITFSGLSTAGIVTNTSGGVLGTTSTIGVTLGGTGTSTQFTQGSIVFAGASGVYTQDNVNFFWNDADNRLGIGTNAPFSIFHLKGVTSAVQSIEWGDSDYSGGFEFYEDGNYQGGIYSVGSTYSTASQQNDLLLYSSNDFEFYAGGSFFTPKVTFSSSGNVGIGDSSPASLFTVGSGDLFQVNSSGAVAAATGITSSGTITFSALTANRLVATTTGGALTTTITAANLQSSVTGTTGSGNLVFATSPTITGLIVSSGGLTITGDSTFTGHILPGADDTYDLGSNSFRWRDLYLGGETINIGTSTTDQAVISYTTSSNLLNFSTDSTSNGDIAFFSDDLYLDKSSGFIGIGNTSPANLLQVFGSSNPTIQVGGGVSQGTTGGSSTFRWRANNGVVDNIFDATYYKNTGVDRLTFIDGGANNVLTLENGGDVGIGTVSPTTKLHIEGAGNVPHITLQRSDNTTANGLITFRGNDGAIDGVIAYNDYVGAALTFGTGAGGATTKMTILDNGNVGIGETSPTAKLQLGNTAATLANIVNISGRTAIEDSHGLLVSNAIQIATAAVTDVGGVKILPTISNNLSGIEATNYRGLYIPTPAGAGTVTNAYGLYVDAPTQGASNYAAIFNGGSVGIGTSSPGAILDVRNTRTSGANAVGLILSDPVTGAQTGGFGTLLRFSSNSGQAIAEIMGGQGDAAGDGSNNQTQLRFRTQDSNGGIADRMTITSVGNVGIGTTSPSGKLSIVGTSGQLATVIGDAGFGTGYAGISVQGTLIGTNYSLLGDGTNLYLNRPTGGDVYIRENNSAPHLTIKTSSGNVGIGTTSPSARLSLGSTTGIKQKLYDTNGTSDSGLGIDLSGASLAAGVFIPYGTGTDGRFEIVKPTTSGYSAFSPLMTVLGNGQVGIGTTTGANTKLIVYANTSTGGISDAAMIVRQDGTDPVARFQGPGGGGLMTILANGNVGIGTTGPNEKLEINGSIITSVGSGGTLTLYESDATRINRLIAGADASGAYLHSTYSSGGTGDMRFLAAGTEGMRVFTSGNIGIGTTSDPGYQVTIVDISAGGIATRISQQATSGSPFALYSTATGASTQNIAGYFLASGATNNFAVYGEASAATNNYAFYAAGGAKSYFSGDVGIGASSPVAKLHIQGTADGSRVESLALGNSGGADNSSTAIYMGYQDSGLGLYGARILQRGFPSGIRSSDLLFQIHNSTASNADAAWDTALMIQRTTTNVGIGTTNPQFKLAVSNAGVEGLEIGPGFAGGATVLQAYNRNDSSYDDLYIDALSTYFRPSGSSMMSVTSSAVTVGAGGTSGTAAQFILNGGSGSGGGPYIRFNRNSFTNGYFGNDSAINGGTSEDINLYSISSGLRFTAGGNERMRILSTGEVGIGDTSPDYKLDIETDTASFVANFFNDGNATTRSGILIQGGLDDHTAVGPSVLAGFYDGDGTQVGTITFGSSVVAYNTTSDRRLKTNIRDTGIGLSQLMQVRVRDFEWKADKDQSTTTHGFIAQELNEIYPSAVTRPNSPDGLWMVDYSKLAPLIVQSIQDQQRQIENTSVDIVGLELRVDQNNESIGSLETSYADSRLVNTELSSAVNNLLSRISDIESDIETLQDQVANLEENSGSGSGNEDGIFENGITVSGLGLFSGMVSFAQGVIFDSTVQIKNGLVATGASIFEGIVVFNEDAAGYVTIESGATEAEVRFENSYPQAPVVTITPNQNMSAGYYVSDVTDEGFVVHVNENAPEDLQFSWHAVVTASP